MTLGNKTEVSSSARACPKIGFKALHSFEKAPMVMKASAGWLLPGL